jgi:hypothetical protein
MEEGMIGALVTLVLIVTLAPQTTQAVAGPDSSVDVQAQATWQALLKAFTAGDVKGITEHFADKMLFIGDPQFLGEPRGLQVRRELTRDQLSSAYTTLFDAMGRDKWTALVKQSKPSVRRAVKAESHIEDTSVRRAVKAESHIEDTTGILPADFIKAGEYVCELRFPGSGLDDVLLFVLRPIDGKFKVVAHWADY